VRCDLLGSPLSRDVLYVRQLGPPGRSSQDDEIFGDQRDSASRTFLPWRVRGRIDNDLPDDSPPGVMRIATCDQEPGERVGDRLDVSIGRVEIEVPQRRADVATAIHRPRQVTCGWRRSISSRVDQYRVPVATAPVILRQIEE
jgi:hypothetical protein